MAFENLAGSKPLLPVSDEHWLDAERMRLYSCAALICYVVFFGIWMYRAWILNIAGLFPPGADFVVFWSAAKVALEHGAVAPYNLDLLQAKEIATVPQVLVGGGALPWLYPPTFLLAILPLGLLPYGAAAFVFLTGGACWYGWAMSRTLPWRGAWIAALGFPGVAVCIATGQNSLWLAGTAGLALTLLRQRPVLAGALLGLVTVKPHIAIMFPLALLCAGQWRALLGMAASAAALAALSLVCFGVEPVLAFLSATGLARAAVENGTAPLIRMPTMFAATKLLFGGVVLPYVVHAVCACAAVASVIYAWSRPCSFALRAAVLSTAMLLVPPYLYDYDLAFLGIAMAWLGIHAHRCGWLTGERELLVVLWLLPLYGLLLGEWFGIQLMPIGLVLALALGVWRIRLERVDPH
ncbi:glycosyltransferase family 87 protein [Cupriavidus pinatubonensis]|uniref:glycosyltransferase family 87 protein n=1 Tax=Cupriavidus pinatubonensis TaxID=248026 RepID=UPI00361E34CE